ncbi:amidohydrolase family protein (plasmid) [Thioclava sp. 'Guangxiensis']|uniref:amidohydrolase family protein n=1 Tax=Thioclava sp. 'Guangxiensis' TaxID=3149044 RepID=UPI0032C3DF74
MPDKTPDITGIDTHAHIFSPDQPMAEGRRYTPDYTARLEDWLAHMADHGLSHGVLIQPSFLGTDNGLIAEAISQHPHHLRGVAVVDPEMSESALARLDAQGFVGARLNLVGRPLEAYDSAQWQRFFRRLADLGWQVEIQRAFEDFATIVPPIATSGVAVMIDHFGLPKGGIRPEDAAHRAVLEMLRAHPNAYVKLSAPYRSAQDDVAAHRSFEALREACGGVARFCWGSDWPHTQHETAVSYDDQMTRFAALVPDADDRARILVTTPADLFRFSK